MDARNKRLLQVYQQDIVSDLDVTHVLDNLFTKKAISDEDFDKIFKFPTREEQVRFLLQTIINHGNNNTFESFVDSLAKDYRWLWEKLAIESHEPMLNESFEDSLSRGDVPRLPDHYVRRTAVEQTVADKLKQLSRHNFLVLHGMSGCGKTTIVTSVLRAKENSDLINTNFNGVMFWLNVGDCKTEDDIIAQQNNIGSNADSHSLSGYELTVLELRDRLKTQFSEPTLKEALLVLDEVNEKKIVEAFDIGCKILITTRDTDVVANFQPQILKIENSFDESETLKLFASCLGITVDQLPRQAKKLHDVCKGSPFHIGLIGAQLSENRERFIHDRSYWSHYLSMLEKKDYFFLTRHNNNPMKTIEVCINSLKPNILPLFKMLTVLPDNVKVTAKVLSKLWNKDVNEVESIMKQLRSKSLIIEFYDLDQKNYIYEIHDLIMNYLRTCTNEEDTKRLHANFLKSYHYDTVSKSPVQIVDDGYIAFYIGYHILNTKNLDKKWSLFNRLYLDLRFLGNKVRLTGPADVILDLQKYEKYIADDDFDRELIYSVKGFLSTHGIDLYRYPSTDIVQSVLQHENKGILYTKAVQVAQDRCAKNELYFDFLHEQNVEEIKPSNIDVKESITSVCFLGDYALVGTLDGVIKFFHISTNKLKKELPSAGSPIKWVGTCPLTPAMVAALTDDGDVRIWYIDDVEQDETEDVIEEEPEESYNNNYKSNVQILAKRGPHLNCRWANNSELLITHTTKSIIIYTPNGEIHKVIEIELNRDIVCCVPCNKDKHVILATNHGNVYNIEVYNLETKEKIMFFKETGPMLDILTVPGSNKIITLKSNEIQEHELKLNAGSYQNCNICRCKQVIHTNGIKEDLSFTSTAVNKAGNLLFVSTDDSRVICVDLKTYFRVFDLDNRRGNVISMAVSEVLDDFMPGADVLLTGTGTIENSVKVWYLDSAFVSQNTKNGKVRLTTKFDVSFVNTLSPQTPSTTSTNSAAQSANNTPKRHQSFTQHEVEKKPAKKTMSLDRHSLKPLVLKGICNGNNEDGTQPLLAVVDDKNSIQIMRGRKVLTEIPAKTDEVITTVKISPCNQYILYGFKSGIVNKYTLRTKDVKPIMDVNSPVQYLSFANANLLMVAGKNRCLMAYRLNELGEWMPRMLQPGNTHLGSQEILNDIQGKRKLSPSERLSNSDSDSSLASKDRLFSNGDRQNLCKTSGLVECFWIKDVGLLTIEHNATVKLWDRELELSTVLSGRQKDVNIICAAFQKNVLVICDDNRGFQTFELKDGDQMELHSIQEYRLNNLIISCDLTTDGYILAVGLDSGDVVVWNVPQGRQIRLLKHHKTKVQSCRFSPVPSRLSRSTQNSPLPAPTYAEGDDDQPPLVLVTMASEIVWWHVTYIIKMRASKPYWRIGLNVVTPAASPIDNRSSLTAAIDNLALRSPTNFFFGDQCPVAQECWKDTWKRKTYKEGSQKKEILACIKLSGMNAKKLCFDDKFSCFVTVDNPGHIHIMNVMKAKNT